VEGLLPRRLRQTLDHLTLFLGFPDVLLDALAQAGVVLQPGRLGSEHLFRLLFHAVGVAKPIDKIVFWGCSHGELLLEKRRGNGRRPPPNPGAV